MSQGLEKIGQFDDLFRVVNEYLDRTRSLWVVDAGYHIGVFRIAKDRTQESAAQFPTITQAVAWSLAQPVDFRTLPPEDIERVYEALRLGRTTPFVKDFDGLLDEGEGE